MAATVYIWRNSANAAGHVAPVSLCSSYLRRLCGQNFPALRYATWQNSRILPAHVDIRGCLALKNPD